MMKVAIYGRFENNFPKEYVGIVLEQLSIHNISVYIEVFCIKIYKTNFTEDYKSFNSYKDLDDSFAFFISIGGDGTILRSISYVRNSGIPIVGVNTGRMGFLATIQKDKIKSSIDEIVKGEYDISERSLLKLKSELK